MQNIFVKERGAGTPVILLHGFPMNHQVWDPFAELLSKEFHVMTPDLPGFGQSKMLSNTFTLSDVAKEIAKWIESNGIKNSVLIGHSLGGYISLALIELYPQLFSGLVLFHSTAYPDTNEKKESRTKVLKFIEEKGVLAFTSNFIQPLFASPHHSAIPFVKDICMQASVEAVKGYTVAMRDRPDRTQVLQKFDKPIAFIAGTKDASIPIENILQQAEVVKNPTIHILEDTAHMGMFERATDMLNHVKSFITSILYQK